MIRNAYGKGEHIGTREKGARAAERRGSMPQIVVLGIIVWVSKDVSRCASRRHSARVDVEWCESGVDRCTEVQGWTEARAAFFLSVQ